MTRDQQFEIISRVDAGLTSWAEANSYSLYRIDHSIGFGDDYSMDVWFFFDTDAINAAHSERGITDQFSAKYAALLKDHGYDARWLAETSYFFDSHENVERNYEGSYFYRLR
jgi:hypothetical protein